MPSKASNSSSSRHRHKNNHRKKKKSHNHQTSNNNNQSKKNKKPFSNWHQWMEAGDHAVQTDPFHARALYTTALERLLEQQQQQDQQNKDEDTSRTKDSPSYLSDSTTWVTSRLDLLEKRAEVAVSLSDQDSALQDYQTAVTVLSEHMTATTSQSGMDLSMCETVLTPQLHETWLERKAALYLTMGQLQESEHALESYHNGIQELHALLQLRRQKQQKQLQSPEKDSLLTTQMEPDHDHDAVDINDHPIDDVRRQIAKAYCAAAELYLTDLCFEVGAETECEAYIQKAFAVLRQNDNQILVSTNGISTATEISSTPPDLIVVDVLQVAASLRLSQSPDKRLEGVTFILQAFDQMRIGCQALSALVGMCDPSQQQQQDHQATSAAASEELLELNQVQNLPGYEFRCQTAKILLECATLLTDEAATLTTHGRASNDTAAASNTTASAIQPLKHEQQQQQQQKQQCLQAAIDVLGSLLAENDEVVEIWSLAGEAFWALDQPSTAAYYWRRAVDMLNEVQLSMEQELDGDDIDNNNDDEEALQQKLEEVICQKEELQGRLADITDDDMDETSDDNNMEEN